MQEEASQAIQSALADKAARLRVGAHLALALAYLPIGVPEPQLSLPTAHQDVANNLDEQDDIGLHEYGRDDWQLQVKLL